VGNPVLVASAGWLAGRVRRASVAGLGPVHFRFEIEAIGSFLLSGDDGAVTVVTRHPAATDAEIAEVQAGLLAAYVLSLKGVFCLHAGGAALSGGILAFLGESGNGKSTLAWHLGHAGNGWRHAGDDVLPVELTPDGVQAQPHFPQLKFPPDEQPWLGLPERMPLRAAYVIAQPSPVRREIAVERLAQQEAALALVRHTVAARLFDRELLANHLAFATQAAQRIPVRRLLYPRDYGLLPRVAAAIEADLAGLT
jgi:hypothetical protein